MSVNAVSGASLKSDLVNALRQARAANAKQADASAFATASQDTGAAQSTGSASQASGAASGTPALSNDLMASLLQLQSDFSQMGLQNGVTSSADPASASDESSALGTTGASQASNAAAPVHHHHGHHFRPPASDAEDAAQTGQSGSAADATAAPGTPANAQAPSTTGSATDLGNDLQSFLQQVTKAISAYAVGGPAGIAAAALTSTKAGTA